MKLVPLNIPDPSKPQGRIIAVRRVHPEKVGTLIVPESVRDRHAPNEADVIAVSGETQQLIKDDHIVFADYTGVEITLDGTKYIVMRESDVIARIEEATDESPASNAA